MTWKIKEALQQRLNQETGFVKKNWGGKIKIALVYPNLYRVGMGNLAIHTLYKMINERPDFVCERFFLPSPKELDEYKKSNTPILSLESQMPLYEFDAVAFSISFENDFPKFCITKLICSCCSNSL